MSVKFKQFDLSELKSPVNIPREDINGVRHYRIDEKTCLPSMTTILKLLDDGGLDTWRKRVGAKEADRIALDASTRGDQLHALCERYVLNTLKREDLPSGSDNGVRRMFNAIKGKIDTFDKIIGVELPLYSRSLGYAGTADLIGRKGNKLFVGDFKNSRRQIDLNKDYCRRKLFKYKLQCVGYALAFFELYGEPASMGEVIVGYYDAHNFKQSDSFPFEIDKYWIDEFELLIMAHRGLADIQESAFFKL